MKKLLALFGLLLCGCSPASATVSGLKLAPTLSPFEPKLTLSGSTSGFDPKTIEIVHPGDVRSVVRCKTASGVVSCRHEDLTLTKVQPLPADHPWHFYSDTLGMCLPCNLTHDPECRGRFLKP